MHCQYAQRLESSARYKVKAGNAGFAKHCTVSVVASDIGRLFLLVGLRSRGPCQLRHYPNFKLEW